MSLPKTILLVEREPLLLKYFQTILQLAGYSVLPAGSAQEAIRIEKTYSRTIDLLVTGGFLPGSSGPLLATQLASRRPGLRVMLISSNPDASTLAASKGWMFIGKPFLPSALLDRISLGLARDEVRAESAGANHRTREDNINYLS